MHNQEFVSMPANEVAKLLANDSLNVMNEEMVFHALVLWAKHDVAARKKHLSKLLVHIKLPLLSPQVRSATRQPSVIHQRCHSMSSCILHCFLIIVG